MVRQYVADLLTAPSVSISVGIVPLADEYNWPPVTQGLVLSAFYWTYIVTQIPGGYFANRFGFKVGPLSFVSARTERDVW